MKLLATLLLLGQVGSNGGEFTPPSSGEFTPRPVVVGTDGPPGLPPAQPPSTPPGYGAGEVPTRPGARMSFGDDSGQPSVPTTGIAPGSTPAASLGNPSTAPGGGSGGFVPNGSTAPAGTMSMRGAPSTATTPSSMNPQYQDPNPAASSAVNPTAGLPVNSPALQAAGQLMSDLIAVDAATPGLRRLPLVDALTHHGDPAAQSESIDAYWNLFQAIAHSRFASDIVKLLQSIPQPADPSDRALLEAALYQAEAEEENEQQELLAAQYRVIRASAMAWDGQLPWPVDSPLIAPYRTNFDSYYAQRIPPLQIRFIHHSLPNQLRLVEKRFHAVASAESAADATIEAVKLGRGSVTVAIDTVRQLNQARRNLITAVVDYNGRIAEYSLATVGSGLGPDTLVSTLIKSAAPSANLVNVPRGVRQASADAPVLIEGGIIQR